MTAHCRPLLGCWKLGSVSWVTEASFEEELVTNMTYADQMHEARFLWGAADADAARCGAEQMVAFWGI